MMTSIQLILLIFWLTPISIVFFISILKTIKGQRPPFGSFLLTDRRTLSKTQALESDHSTPFSKIPTTAHYDVGPTQRLTLYLN